MMARFASGLLGGAGRSSLKLMVSNQRSRDGPAPTSSRDDHGPLCRNRRVSGILERLRCGRDRPNRSRGQDRQRARGAHRLVRFIGLCADPDRPGGWSALAMALRGDEESRAGGRAFRDAARARCLQGDAGQVRSQRRARDCAADAAWLVSAGALQVDWAQEIRAELTARKLVESKLRDISNSLRGILRGFGLKVGATTERSFPGRVRELVKGHPVLEAIAESLLSVHEVLLREFNGFQKRVQSAACSNVKARLLMTTPGVGPVISLTYSAAVDDPARFKSSKKAGSHFGLTPKKYQSGETDRSGRISKIGDVSVRAALYQAAHVILTKPVKELKSWGMR